MPEPFELRGHHLAIELGAARALFTTRRGGVSDGPYATLNLGRKTPDRPEAVAANRAAVALQAGVTLAFTRQVHGTEVVAVSEAPTELPEADGQATTVHGLGVAALVADCLPVALAADGAVAIVHAGWRGLAGGVIEQGVAALSRLGGEGELRAAIGPGAGPCCYEVGDEVRAALDRWPQALRDGTADLKAVARAQLEQAGATEVYDVGMCTICSDPRLFFSHRRDRGVTGRQAGIAWLPSNDVHLLSPPES